MFLLSPRLKLPLAQNNMQTRGTSSGDWFWTSTVPSSEVSHARSWADRPFYDSPNRSLEKSLCWANIVQVFSLPQCPSHCPLYWQQLLYPVSLSTFFWIRPRPLLCPPILSLSSCPLQSHHLAVESCPSPPSCYFWLIRTVQGSQRTQGCLPQISLVNPLSMPGK